MFLWSIVLSHALSIGLAIVEYDTELTKYPHLTSSNPASVLVNNIIHSSPYSTYLQFNARISSVVTPHIPHTDDGLFRELWVAVWVQFPIQLISHMMMRGLSKLFSVNSCWIKLSFIVLADNLLIIQMKLWLAGRGITNSMAAAVNFLNLLSASFLPTIQS